jgi:ABC-type multidrug transport system ATPase subunit
MIINLSNLGKRYNRDWIFRNLSFQFNAAKHYAITGPNGSGKSTLLQIIAGSTTHNEGLISYLDSTVVTTENVFKKISFSAPYLDLIEEMTLVEFFTFHQQMKGWISGATIKEIISLITLERSSHKQIRYFSSGMKQRVKLAQAIFSNVPAVLLDEPLTNLDDEGISLYHSLIKKYCADRLVIVSSNNKDEYSFCEEQINMTDFKSLDPSPTGIRING